MINELPVMNQMADKMLSDLDSFVTLCQATFQDTEFSLEARWTLYLKVEKLLPVDSFHANHLSTLTNSVYDDLYLERYQFVNNSSIDEQVVERYSDEDERDSRTTAMFEKRDAWREAVLKEGQGGFTYDW